MVEQAAKNNNNSINHSKIIIETQQQRMGEGRKRREKLCEISVFGIIYDINLNIFTLKALRFVDS